MTEKSVAARRLDLATFDVVYDKASEKAVHHHHHHHNPHTTRSTSAMGVSSLLTFLKLTHVGLAGTRSPLFFGAFRAPRTFSGTATVRRAADPTTVH